MRKSAARTAGAALALAAVAWLACTAAWAASPDGNQAAVWTPKELQFIYQGFTTYYSCDGLRDKVRDILLSLGARKEDLVVNETACAGFTGGPTPFPGVMIRMNVLQPAAAGKVSAATAEAVPARWKKVELKPDRSGVDQGGECELVEQVKQRILPLFATRHVDYESNCVPHQLDPGGTHLSAEVLVPAWKNGADSPPK